MDPDDIDQTIYLRFQQLGSNLEEAFGESSVHEMIWQDASMYGHFTLSKDAVSAGRGVYVITSTFDPLSSYWIIHAERGNREITLDGIPEATRSKIEKALEESGHEVIDPADLSRPYDGQLAWMRKASRDWRFRFFDLY
jgi:hypothetical protein